MENGRGFIGIRSDFHGIYWGSANKCVWKHTQASIEQPRSTRTSTRYRPCGDAVDFYTLIGLAYMPRTYYIYASKLLTLVFSVFSLFCSQRNLLWRSMHGCALKTLLRRLAARVVLLYAALFPPRQSGSAFISLGTSENHLYIHVLSHIQYSMHSIIRLYAATLLT